MSNPIFVKDALYNALEAALTAEAAARAAAIAALTSQALVWQKIAVIGSYACAVGDAMLFDTSGGICTLLLPSTVEANQSVYVGDYAGTFDTHKLVINNNGNPLMGANFAIDVTTKWETLTLTYIDSTVGWRIM